MLTDLLPLQMGAQPGTPAQLLWSHPVLSGMQQHAQNAAQLSLCSLSTVSMSGNRHNVAVLATASDGTVALQLLSVSLKAKPEELSTHIMNLGEDRDMQGSGKASKWSCCCSRQGEVLIWREGGSAYKWTLLTGLYMWLSAFWRSQCMWARDTVCLRGQHYNNKLCCTLRSITPFKFVSVPSGRLQTHTFTDSLHTVQVMLC